MNENKPPVTQPSPMFAPSRKEQTKAVLFFIGLAIGLIFGALMTLGVLMVP